MKILQIGSSLESWGGIERYIAYLSEGLEQRGHDVTVACAPSSPLALHVSAKTIPIRVRRKFDFQAFAQYLKCFRHNRFDAVHVHFSPDFLLPAMAARITRQPASIMTRHVVLPWTSTKVQLYCTLFDHFIPVSDAVERVLISSGVPKSRMTVAKAGCPPLQPKVDRSALRAQLGVSQDGVAFGFFGRLVVEKGIDTLIEASQALPANASYEVFGSGPLSDKLQQRAKASGGRVHFHGFRDDVPECIQAMDAVVIPSVWEEAFPYAALEAMSVGRPVIASRAGGMPEIVSNGETGFLFDKGDSQELARIVARLSADPALLTAMGAKGQKEHRCQYTVECMAERIEGVYKSLKVPSPQKRHQPAL